MVVPKKIKLTDWSGIDDAWVKQSHPFAFEIINKIIEKKRIIQDLIKRSYSFTKTITFEMIFQHLQRKGDINLFYDFMDGCIKKPPEVLEENTLKKYRTALTLEKTPTITPCRHYDLDIFAGGELGSA